MTRGTSQAPRVLQVLPAIAVLATFGVFFVDKNREARTVFTSGRGLLTMAVIVGSYLVVGFLLRRVVRWAWVAPVCLAALTVVLAAWTIRPYYVDETANRRLTAGPVRDASASPELQPGTSTEPQTAPSSAPPSSTTEPPTVAVRVSSGPIQGIDHDASGMASVIRNPDGSLIVRFEQFAIEGTPDPRVLLVRGNDVEDRGGTDLGRLTGNQGEVFDYAVPAGIGGGVGWTVLVWCERFAVPIANATQVSA